MRLALASAGALLLAACGDGKKAEETPAAPKQADPAQQAAAAANEAVEQTRDALLQEAVIKLGAVLDDYAIARETPDINEQVRNVLEKMNAYHEALVQAGQNSPLRMQLALRIAECTQNLGATAKAAEAYEQAQQSLDALPEDFRTGTEGSRAASSILRGRALCLLRQNKAAEAEPLSNFSLTVVRACSGNPVRGARWDRVPPLMLSLMCGKRMPLNMAVMWRICPFWGNGERWVPPREP